MLQRKLAGPDLEPGRAGQGGGAVGKATLTGALPMAATGPTGQPTKGSGAPLSATARRKMEAAFGADFSAVRVHEDGLAEANGAKAFAEGTDLHFAPGHYDPESEAGLALIGHELAHVVQQSQGRVAGGQGKGGVNADPGLEAEADDLGQRAARGEQVARAGAVGGAAGVKQLKPSSALAPTDEGREFDVHVFANSDETQRGVYRRTDAMGCWFARPNGSEFAIRPGALECTPRDGKGDHVAPHAPLHPKDGPTMGTGTAGLSAKHILEALEAGCRLLDLAESYENLDQVAEAIRASGIPRAQLQLVFKLRPVKIEKTEHGWEARLVELVTAKLQRACKQLDTGYLDVVMLHDLVADKEVVHGNLKALKQLQKGGLFLQLGLSNVESVGDLKELGEGVDVIQNELSPLHQDTEVREACAQLGKAYMGYSVLGGQLTFEQITKHPTLIQIAKELDVSVPQVVLAWAMTLGTIQIPSSRSGRQPENLRAIKLCPLADHYVQAITKLDRKEQLPEDDVQGGGMEVVQGTPLQQLRELLFAVMTGSSPMAAMILVKQFLDTDPTMLPMIKALRKQNPEALRLAQKICALDILDCEYPKTAQAMLDAIKEFRM